jgi:lipopolysaccharide assembly outer membrane protein LptD (OstA)
MKNKIFKIFFIFFFPVILLTGYFKFIKDNTSVDNNKLNEATNVAIEDDSNNSNIIKNIKHVSKDLKGNEYIVEALEGEINLSNTDIMYLKDVTATIKIKDDRDIVLITSNFAQYNIQSYDTIFSENVIVNYSENKMTGEYLDFSLINNLLTISENVIYTNNENILKADIAEMNIKSKDTKIFMFENYKKINIQSKNYNGNNKKISN